MCQSKFLQKSESVSRHTLPSKALSTNKAMPYARPTLFKIKLLIKSGIFALTNNFR
jgi:hypothetical protein